MKTCRVQPVGFQLFDFFFENSRAKADAENKKTMKHHKPASSDPGGRDRGHLFGFGGEEMSSGKAFEAEDALKM